MSKKVIIFLIVFMAIVMIGLILVQTNTINKTYEIREEQFDQTVNRTLKRVIDKMERDETVDIVNGTFKSSSSSEDLLKLSKKDKNIVYSNQINFSFNYSQKIATLEYHKRIVSGSYSPPENERGKPGEFPSAFDMFHDHDNYIQQQYEKRLDERADMYRIIQKQFNFSQLPIGERIDQKKLERSLKTELYNSGITLIFKYAVKSYTNGEEKFIFGSNKYNPQNQKEYRDILFPRDLSGPNPNYLRIYYPNRDKYLMKATGLMVIPIFILTGLLIAIFIYTILIILKQKKLSSIKNDFINNMTHELKTPLATISLASQMLHDNSIAMTPEATKNAAGIIMKESKRLSFQVEKVLQMAVFNEGRLRLKFKEFHLNDVITNIVVNFDLRVTSEGGKLSTNLEAENDLVKGDELHITNVIYNLLDNALKYRNGIPEISIKTENKKDYFLLSVKDKGIGIPKEHIDQIFERFFRVPTGNVHDVKGFGLGLSYVKKIIDIHHGKIKVDSTVNKGTIFVIYLPLINSKENGNKS